ncbi:MAG TPA: hypothetical protein ENJ37_05750 [Deltaproteobacteria bacterium]|nr:hypothetical protein [Deltaproteobacteria bacterium]
MDPAAYLSYIKDLDRRTVYGVAAAAALLAALVWGVFAVRDAFDGLSRSLKAKRAAIERFTDLSDEYLRLRAATEVNARRAAAPRGDVSLVAVMEEVAGRCGLRERMTSIKPLEERTLNGYIERAVEASFEGVDMNETVNLLFKLERHRLLLMVREFSMKSRFKDPETLDLKLKVVHVARAGG